MPLKPEDEEKLIKEINYRINQIPPLPLQGRRYILRKTLPEMLKEIPESFYDYTVRDIIEALEKAWREGRIRW